MARSDGTELDESTYVDFIGEIGRCLLEIPLDAVNRARHLIMSTLQTGHAIYTCGNGGSAALAQHLATDLGSMASAKRDVRSLVGNEALLTAIGNDDSFDAIFTRQLEGLLGEGDLLIAITGSGNSPNIVNALNLARERHASCLALTGFDSGVAGMCSDVCLHVRVNDYGIVEACHSALGHILTRTPRSFAATRLYAR